jgi:hypothetical protein
VDGLECEGRGNALAVITGSKSPQQFNVELLIISITIDLGCGRKFFSYQKSIKSALKLDF